MVAEVKQVRIFRVKYNSLGALPKTFFEGHIVGFTSTEIETLEKNPLLRECFEEIQILPAQPTVGPIKTDCEVK